MSKKGLSERVLDRLRNFYKDSVSVTVVNNVMGKSFSNVRGSL